MNIYCLTTNRQSSKFCWLLHHRPGRMAYMTTLSLSELSALFIWQSVMIWLRDVPVGCSGKCLNVPEWLSFTCETVWILISAFLLITGSYCLCFIQVQCLYFWNCCLHLTRTFASKLSGLSAILSVDTTNFLLVAVMELGMLWWWYLVMIAFCVVIHDSS